MKCLNCQNELEIDYSQIPEDAKTANVFCNNCGRLNYIFLEKDEEQTNQEDNYDEANLDSQNNIQSGEFAENNNHTEDETAIQENNTKKQRYSIIMVLILAVVAIGLILFINSGFLKNNLFNFTSNSGTNYSSGSKKNNSKNSYTENYTQEHIDDNSEENEDEDEEDDDFDPEHPYGTLSDSDFEFDIDQYYEDNSDKIIKTIPYVGDKDTLTEKEAVSLLKKRGFSDFEITYEYDELGEPVEKITITNPTNNRHPMYDTYYYSDDTGYWSITVVQDKVYAFPFGLLLENEVDHEIILSESKEIKSYDSNDKKYFITIPKKSAVEVRVVKEVNNKALDRFELD